MTFSASSPTGEAWDILDRFIGSLQSVSDVSRQLTATLEMVRASTGADIVFLYSGTANSVTEWRGPGPGDRAGWAELARRLLESAVPGEAHLLKSHFSDGANLSPRPCSAALVRLSRSRAAWIVAIRCDEKRPIVARDLRPMALARKLLLQQQQQGAGYEELKELLFGLVRCLTAALDARDAYTWGHSERVARIAVRLGEELGLPGSVRSDLYLAGLLHDVGKIGLIDSVLRKPGPLTPEEMALVKEHPVIGDSIVAHVRQLAHLRAGVRNHHERWDGLGYPDRLAGEAIPLLARVLAVADSCDAILSARPYRQALPPARLEAILSQGSGTQWDPTTIQAFFACRHDVYAIGQRGLGDSVVQAVEQALKAGELAAGAARGSLLLQGLGN